MGVRVLHDLLHIVGQVGNGAGNLDRQQVTTLPRLDARLTGEDLEQPVIVGHVGSNRDTALLACLGEDVREGLVSQPGRGLRVGDAEPAEVAREKVVRGVGGIDAQNVNTLARRQLEAGKDVDATSFGGGAERGDAADVVVVGDGEHGDAEVRRFLNDRPGVIDSVAGRCVAPVGGIVVVRVHLKRATMEHRAARDFPCLGDHIIGSHGAPHVDTGRSLEACRARTGSIASGLIPCSWHRAGERLRRTCNAS